MDAKYDVEELRRKAEFFRAPVQGSTVLDWKSAQLFGDQLSAVLDEIATLKHENESWRLIEEQNHRDLERYRQALKRLAEMDYACDDKECMASDVANAALDPAKD